MLTSRSENINVALRFRPLNQREHEERDPIIWQVRQSAVGLRSEWIETLQECKRLSNITKNYSYNYCFTENDDN